MSHTTTRRFLVTAGGTRERIDAVRDWSNVFTGNTGYAIAHALARLGSVDLLTSNLAHLRELTAASDASAIQGIGFATHADLKAALAERMARHRYDGIFMTAAVADFRPVGAYEIVSREPAGAAGQERWLVRNAQAAKIRSSYDEIAILGQRTEKLVDHFRTTWGHRGLLVKFKLEVDIGVDRLLEIGRASRAASGADYLVANTLAIVEGEGAGAYLIGPDDSAEFVARPELPARLARLAEAWRRLE